MISIINSIRDAVLAHGFKWFAAGDFDLNVVAVRTPEQEAGHFDDFLTCTYLAGGEWRTHWWACTTDPGRAVLLARPTSVISHPQQARGAYNLGLHKGRPAVVQHSGPVETWIDKDRDTRVAHFPYPGKPGWLGINIHDTLDPTGVATRNDRSSGGCIVQPVAADNLSLRQLLKRQELAGHGKTLSLTVIHADDLG